MNAPHLIPIAVLVAPLAAANPVASLGRSLWLYVALTRHVNTAGLVIRRREQLAADLAISESEIDHWLDRLRNARLLEVLSSSPFLTVRLLLWSAEGLQASENAVLSAVDKEESNSKQSNAAAISISSNAIAGEGSPGEGDLRAAVAEMLPDAAPVEIDAVLDHYAHATIRKAVDRVRNAGRIRKSKTALFRYLLAKFSESIDVSER